MPSPTPDDRRDAGALLRLYLDDHWAAAGGGADLARRIERNNADSEWSGRLHDIADAVEEDDRTLEKIRSALGARGGGLKRVVARLGQMAGRVIPNRRVTRYSPLSRVLEAEGMLAGVSAKHRLWDALRTGVDDVAALEPFDLDELLRRAEHQLEVLAEFHRFACRQAFGPVADSTAVG